MSRSRSPVRKSSSRLFSDVFGGRKPQRRSLSFRRLNTEALEERRLLAVLWVDNTPGMAGTEFTSTGGTQPASVPGLTPGMSIFSTISAAVAFASPMDEINVSDGTYAELVTVNKAGLLLQGNKFGLDARTRLTANETIVDATGLGAAFSISEDNVFLDGFSIQGQTGGFPGASIWMQPGTEGTEVRNDIIQNNVVGIFVSNNSAMNPTVIEKNLFQNQTNPGAAGGHSIYADEFTAGAGIQNILVDNNNFTNSAVTVNSWAMGISNSNSAMPFMNITFSHNDVTNHGRGMYFFNTDGANVSNNNIAGTTNYAIGVFTIAGPDRNANIDILNNTLTSNNRAVWVDGHLGEIDVNFNKITGSATASIQNDDASATVDASANYWGTSNPATVAATLGGTNSAAIDFTPLLDNDESVGNMSVIGFQPDLTSVTVHTLGFQVPGPTRINEGIAVASSGGTVNVTAGTFNENVVLNKSLTLKGAQFGVDARGRVVGAPNPAVETVVTTTTGRALELQDLADNATINGFAFLGSGPNGTVENTTGAGNTNLQFLNNYVAVSTGSTTPLFMNRSAVEATFDKNEFVAATGSAQAIFFDGADAFHGLYFTNNNVLRAGALGGTGLFVDGNRNVGTTGGVRTPLVQGNLFQNHALGFNGGQRSFDDTEFVENTFTMNTGGMAAGPLDSTIARNTFSSNSLYGLRLTGFGGSSLTDPTKGAQTSTVTQNVFTGNGTTVDVVNGYGDIRIDDQFNGTQSTNNIFNNSLGSAVNVFNKETNPEIIQVSGNWWGTASNPETAGKILGAAAANVDYSPWLNSGVDTNGGMAGFQGSLASLHVDDDSAFSTLAYGTVVPVANQYITEGIALLTGGPLRLQVHNGTYVENVDVNKALTFVPGDSPGIVNITGNYTFSVVGSTLEMEVNGTTPGVPLGHDQINVSGIVDLNGADNINNKVTLAVSSTTMSNVLDLYDIITSASGPIQGEFANPMDTVVSTGVVNTFFISYNPGDDVVRLVSFSGGDPATTYADDDWAGFADGQFIADVDPVMGGNQNGYFNVNAFETIQDAVDAVLVGGTVKVNAHGPHAAPTGAYDENVSIAKALTLDGNGGAMGTTATAVVIDPLAGNGIAVIAGGDNVTIQDLRVTGGLFGITAISVSALTLSNVQTDANSGDGIIVNTLTGTTTLTGVVSMNNGDDGFEGNGLGAVNISSSNFSNNGAVSLFGDGIQLLNVGAVTTTSVTADGNDPGIYIEGAPSFSDTDGTYSNNDDHGIQLKDISGAVTLVRTIADNNDVDNDGIGDGVNATDGGDGGLDAIGSLLVQGGRFRDLGGINDHQERGVFVSVVDATGTVVFQNSAGPVVVTAVTGNESGGVLISDGGTTADFTNGSYSLNGTLAAHHGIGLAGFSSTVTLTSVTADFNGGDGLNASNTGNVSVLTSGSFSSNGSDGIELDSVGNVAINGATVDQNANDGLDLDTAGGGAGTVQVTGGTYNNNGASTATGDGLDIDNVGAVTFNMVTARGNDPGLELSDAASFSDTDGNFSDNDDHGIRLIDIAGAVTLIRTMADNNDRNDDGVGDGLHAIDGGDGGSDAIGSLLVQGARFRDTGGGLDHQERGVFVSQVSGSVVFQDSAGPLQSVTVTGNEGNGVVISDGGTTAAFTNGTYSSNAGNGIQLADVGSFSGNVTLTNVTASSNGFSGVVAHMLNGTTTITGGTFNSNTGNGLFLNGNGAGTHLLVNMGVGNTANLNSADGLHATQFLGSVDINNRTFTGNTGDGVDLLNVANVIFNDNSVNTHNGAGDAGLRLNNVATISVLGSSFTGNTTGVHVQAGNTGVEIGPDTVVPADSNTFTVPNQVGGAVGVLVSAGQSADIQNNLTSFIGTAGANVDTGILLDHAGDTTIDGNTFNGLYQAIRILGAAAPATTVFDIISNHFNQGGRGPGVVTDGLGIVITGDDAMGTGTPAVVQINGRGRDMTHNVFRDYSGPLFGADGYAVTLRDFVTGQIGNLDYDALCNDWHAGPTPPEADVPARIEDMVYDKLDEAALGRLFAVSAQVTEVRLGAFRDLPTLEVTTDLEIFPRELLPSTIVDDGDASFAASAGFTLFAGQGFQNDVRSAAGDNTGDAATWSFTGLDPGEWVELAVTWTANANRASNAQFTILDNLGGMTVLTPPVINQKVAPNDFFTRGVNWEFLTTEIQVPASGNLVVRLTDNANGFVLADAVRLQGTRQFELVQVTFYHDMVNADNVANYQLVADGVDNIHQTIPYDRTMAAPPFGLVAGDDRGIGLAASVAPSPFAGVVYNSATKTATLAIDKDLDIDHYRLLINADPATGLRAVTNNPDIDPFLLDGDGDNCDIGDDFAMDFTVSRRFDFNFAASVDDPAQSPTQPNYLAVQPQLVFASANDLDGYGWQVALPTNGFNRTGPDSLRRDGHFDSTTRTFRVDLDPGTGVSTDGNGTYTVTVHIGDQTVARDFIKVFAEGSMVASLENITTAAGQFVSLQFDVTVSDGVLDIRFADGGGSDVFWVINGLEVVPTAGQIPIVLTAPNDITPGQVVTITSEPIPHKPDGSLITITPNLGAIVTPDAAANIQGHQVAVMGGVISFNLQAPLGSAATIIDNASVSGFSTAGSWTPFAGQGYQNSVLFSAAGTGSDVATWSFSNLTPGQYAVSTTWSAQANRATNAPYTVRDGGSMGPVLASVAINQEMAPNDFNDQGVPWENLAIVTITGSTMTVQLSDLANEFVIADAVRIQRVGGPVGNLQIKAVDVVGEARGTTVFPITQPADDLFFDLNSNSNATQPGYIGLNNTNNGFNFALGYGWTTLATTFDRGMGNPDQLLRDGHYGSSDNTFRVQLDPAETYNVTMRFRDTFNRDNMQVFVEGAMAPTVNIAFLPANTTNVQTFMVGPIGGDGILDLRFHDTWISGGGGDPFWIVNAIEIDRISMFTAEVGGSSDDAVALSLADAEAITQQAIEIWTSLGSSVPAIEVRVESLPDGVLGFADDNTITLDDDGAGLGWYIDATPGDDSDVGGELIAAGGFDLLTVVLHELGHVLGFEHEDHDGGLMSTSLQPGVRLLPATEEQVALVIDQALETLAAELTLADFHLEASVASDASAADVQGLRLASSYEQTGRLADERSSDVGPIGAGSVIASQSPAMGGGPLSDGSELIDQIFSDWERSSVFDRRHHSQAAAEIDFESLDEAVIEPAAWSQF